MKLKFSILILIALLPATLIGQNENSKLLKIEAREIRSSFITIGGGANYNSFRDFATSPLFYSGPGGILQTSILNFDNQIENELGFIFTGGNYYAQNGNSSSFNGSFYLYYAYLYQLKQLSTKRFNLKAGGTANIAMNIRDNPAFMNNAYGSEYIPTLMGTAKTTLDLSRNNTKNKKLWFINYKLNPRKMMLSYKLNIGILNSTYRNGYAYHGQSALLNNYKEYDGYKFQILSGFRMNSSLDFTYFLKNSNALKISYLWEAYKTGGEFDRYEQSSHNVSISLLFNTK